MALLKALTLFIGELLNGEGAHDLACLFRIVIDGAHEYHRLNALWLLRRQVQEEISPATGANRLKSLDAKMIEQCLYITSSLSLGILSRRVGGASVPAQVGDDQAILVNEFIKIDGPITTRASVAMCFWQR